jgi:hypothetical protein
MAENRAMPGFQLPVISKYEIHIRPKNRNDSNF